VTLVALIEARIAAAEQRGDAVSVIQHASCGMTSVGCAVRTGTMKARSSQRCGLGRRSALSAQIVERRGQSALLFHHGALSVFRQICQHGKHMKLRTKRDRLVQRQRNPSPPRVRAVELRHGGDRRRLL